jgi:hypothetical protein
MRGVFKTPFSSDSTKALAESWLKGSKPAVNIRISHEQFIFMNELRTKLIEVGQYKVPYTKIMDMLISGYKDNARRLEQDGEFN